MFYGGSGKPSKPRHVYDVLGGRNKGLFGESHRAAVLLGIKDGEAAERARGAA